MMSNQYSMNANILKCTIFEGIMDTFSSACIQMGHSVLTIDATTLLETSATRTTGISPDSLSMPCTDTNVTMILPKAVKRTVQLGKPRWKFNSEKNTRSMKVPCATKLNYSCRPFQTYWYIFFLQVLFWIKLCHLPTPTKNKQHYFPNNPVNGPWPYCWWKKSG